MLVAGGRNQIGYLSSSELYDPASDTGTESASLIDTRNGDMATLLTMGGCLVPAGSGGARPRMFDTAER